MNNWKKTTLGDISEKMFSGGTPSTKCKEYYNGNIPWIRTQEVNFNYITSADIKITEDGFLNSSAKWIPENTVIIAMYGNSAGRVAFSKIKATTNQACCNFVADEKKSDPMFVYFNLLGRYKEIEGMANGAAQQNLSVGVLKELEVNLPPLPEQRAIASVLSSLDNKIELLRTQNKTLEKTAQTIFKEWFVNFNFPDKDGEPYKDNGGKMIDSELGKIPEGWRVGKVKEISKIFDYLRVPLSSAEREKRKGVYPYHGATSIMGYVDDYLFDGIYLLLAEDGSVVDDKGFPVLQYIWGRAWVNNHAHVLQGDNGFSTEMLYLLFRVTKVTGIVNGAVQLKINQRNLLNLELILSTKEALEEFSKLIEPWFVKIRSNKDQIKVLTKTRDTLLPKLMSGELRVEDINK